MISDIGDMRFVRRLAPSLAALLLATACQPVASAGKASASPTPSPAGPPKHVFVIVLENTPYRLALRQPYIPGMCNDGHDCGVASADRWLSQTVPQITSSTAWKQGGVLFITWDESGAGDGRVALLVVAPGLQGQLTMPLDHYSLLASIADRLRVPRLGLAKQATSLRPQLEAAAAKNPKSG